MPKASRALGGGIPPQVERLLGSIASSLKTARLRRRITVRDMAERLFVSPSTVVRMEKGDGTVRWGILITAAWILGFDRKLDALLDPLEDEAGARLDLARLPHRADQGVKRSKKKGGQP